jgi:hypothetical protein
VGPPFEVIAAKGEDLLWLMKIYKFIRTNAALDNKFLVRNMFKRVLKVNTGLYARKHYGFPASRTHHELLA